MGKAKHGGWCLAPCAYGAKPDTIPFGWRTSFLKYMHSLTDLPWLVLIWSSKHRKLNGLNVCVTGSDAEAEDVFDKVDAALRMIASYDPALNRQL